MNRLLARYRQVLHHEPKPAGRDHPDAELDRRLVDAQRRGYTAADRTADADESEQRRRLIRGIPAIAQDAGQPNDERRDPLLEVLARERRAVRRRRAEA